MGLLGLMMMMRRGGGLPGLEKGKDKQNNCVRR